MALLSTRKSGSQSVEPLVVDSGTAAKLLGVSPRTLWGETAPRGPIRAVRIGKRCLRYPVEELNRYLAAQQEA